MTGSSGVFRTPKLFSANLHIFFTHGNIVDQEFISDVEKIEIILQIGQVKNLNIIFSSSFMQAPPLLL